MSSKKRACFFFFYSAAVAEIRWKFVFNNFIRYVLHIADVLKTVSDFYELSSFTSVYTSPFSGKLFNYI